MQIYDEDSKIHKHFTYSYIIKRNKVRLFLRENKRFKFKMLSKEIIRNTVQAKCQSLSLEYREEASLKLLHNLMPLLTDISSIAIFNSMDDEINLRPTIDYCQEKNIKLFYPLAFSYSKVMEFMRINDKEELSSLPIIFDFEIESKENIVKWYNIDLILVPLIAIDKAGNRLGRGRGYYDLTFCNKPEVPQYQYNTIKCGVGFDCQMLEKIPIDEWDVKLDFFVSNTSLIKF